MHAKRVDRSVLGQAQRLRGRSRGLFDQRLSLRSRDQLPIGSIAAIDKALGGDRIAQCSQVRGTSRARHQHPATSAGLVRECLHQRLSPLRIAPHLVVERTVRFDAVHARTVDGGHALQGLQLLA